jgi:hypothetical protein
MSNPTLELVKLDAASFMAAVESVKPAQLAKDPDSLIESHNRCRTYIVANYSSQAGQSIIHSDYYSLAILALAKSGGLVLAAPDQTYRAGVLFSDDDEDKKTREIAPLPESPFDPWQRQAKQEEADRIQDAFFDVCGRKLSPAEQVIAARFVSLGKPGELNEMEEVGREVNGKWYIDHSKTAAKRAENRRRNADMRKKK